LIHASAREGWDGGGGGRVLEEFGRRRRRSMRKKEKLNGGALVYQEVVLHLDLFPECHGASSISSESGYLCNSLIRQ